MRRPLLILCTVLVAVAACWAAPASAQDEGDGKNLLRQKQDLRLLQPLDDTTTSLEPEPGIGIFFSYFNLGWPYLLGTAAGIAVLQTLYGGVLIMISAGGEQRSEGIEKVKWGIVGLLMLALSGFILRTLNPIFFT